MKGKLLIVGTLDTKGPDFQFVRDIMLEAGAETLTIDIGVIGEPGFAPDISRADVASAGGANIADFSSGEHKDTAMQVMSNGLVEVVRKLHSEGQVAGIFSIVNGGQ